MLTVNQSVSSRNRNSKGFTLLELIFGIAILSVLITMAAISTRSVAPNLDAKQTANRLVTMLWEARSRAVSGNFQCKLDFDMSNRRFRMQRGSRAYNTPNTTTDWTTVSGYDWESLSSGVSMTSSNPTANVQFNANGTAKLETPAGTVSPTSILNVQIKNNTGGKIYTITASTSGTIILQ